MNRILIAVILLIMPVIVFGQRFGVKAGAGPGNLYTVDKGQSGQLPEYEALISYSVNFNYWHRISDKLMITPGLQLSSLSTTYENTLRLKVPNTQKETLSLLYIRLPLSLSFMLNRFIPHIGPSFGYRINERVKNSVGYYHFYDSKFDYGLEAGLGFKASSRIIFGIDLYNGFGNVDKIGCGNCPTSRSEVSRVRTVEININYMILK